MIKSDNRIIYTKKRTLSFEGNNLSIHRIYFKYNMEKEDDIVRNFDILIT